MKNFLLLSAFICSLTASGQSTKISHSDTSFFYSETTILKSGLPDNFYEVYFDDSLTRLHYEGQIQTNQRKGTWKWYDETGYKNKEANYDNGQLKGPYKEYYANGQLKTQVEVFGGFPEGIMSEWWFNGEKKSEGSFIDGARSGTWKFWNESGFLIKESLYEKGIEIQQ